MALRGKKPEAVQKRLKAFFYGSAGVGKTTAAISFPAPYVIDTERGAENDQYLKVIEANGGAIFQCADFEEILKEVTSLLTEKHDYKTLVIDPITTIYNSLLEVSEKKNGSDFGRHYNEANKNMKRLLNLLTRLDMNVIITAHSKNEYGSGMAVIGQTFDGYKKLDYLFDLVLEIVKRGKDRFAIIKKSRVEGFSDDDTFKFTFAEMAKRYGEDSIAKETTPEVLATKEQISELKRLIEEFSLSQDIVDKWLEKANAFTFTEMKSEDIDKCINYLKSKITGDK